jgi:DNA topoisomerase-1
MKMPREVGEFESLLIVVNIGRFGPYVLHNKKFVSIPKTDDPYTIDNARAVELILTKREADANRLIREWDANPDIKVLNGRFGPYIKAGKKNVKIPKDKVPAELTLEECIALAEAAPEKKGRFGGRRKKE